MKTNDSDKTIRYGAGGGSFHTIVSCCDSSNRQFAMVIQEPPGGGPPLHVHTREDEFFFVLEGEVTLWCDGRISKASAGAGVFLPRDVPHTFKNCAQAPLKMLIVCTPGHIESFFDYGESPEGTAPPSNEMLIHRIATLAPQYGITILGPSPL